MQNATKKGHFSLFFVLLYCLLLKEYAYFSVCKKKKMLFRSIDDVLRSNVLCLRCVMSLCVCVCDVSECVCANRLDLQTVSHCIPLAVA